jgi:2-polyprenyl-3-methyl-5-hydroxy-6-metoxy-1,4-benzoquinol methylase
VLKGVKQLKQFTCQLNHLFIYCGIDLSKIQWRKSKIYIKLLDLFCGLGNFSLPLARCVGESGQVVGVEGSEENRKIDQVPFHLVAIEAIHMPIEPSVHLLWH